MRKKIEKIEIIDFRHDVFEAANKFVNTFFVLKVSPI